MHPDPRSGETPQYECPRCGYRETTDERPSACPDCGGTVQNLSVPRE